jgi:four helix bundle protein
MSSASRREAMPGVRRYEDLFAWQLADQFKQEVSRLIELSQKASRNYAYRDQLLNAASDVSKDISEGFVRCSPLVFASFLNYALGSLVEAERRLEDGVQRGYFSSENCREAFRTGRRCFTATIRLKQSQIRYSKQKSREATQD